MSEYKRPQGGGWELLPSMILGEHSLIDAISIVNDSADYLLEVATARQDDGSILWFIRGYVDDFYVSRTELGCDLAVAAMQLDQLEAEYDCGMSN